MSKRQERLKKKELEKINFEKELREWYVEREDNPRGLKIILPSIEAYDAFSKALIEYGEAQMKKHKIKIG